MEPVIKFREYQKPVFEDNETGVLVLHWSRQIGKSFTLAAWAVDRLLTRPGRLVTVLSNSKDNGAEFALKCREVLNLLGVAKEAVGFAATDDTVEYSDMRFEVTVKVKGKTGRIKVLAANPRTARGFSGDLILDEFAFHEDSNAIWEAAEPILSSNPDFLCRVASTGNGTSNMFYRMATEGFFKVSRVRRSDAWKMGVKIYDAKTRKPITPDEARAQALDKAAYDQNYECAFASESGSLLTHAMISAASLGADNIFSVNEGNAKYIGELFDTLNIPAYAEIYLGMDVAATHDFTVIALLQKIGSTLRGLAVLRIKGARLPAQKAAIRPLLADRRVRRAAIDSTGIGLGLVQDMEDEFPGKVEGVNFATTEPISPRLMAEGRKSPTARVTEIMATELAAAHEDKRISYPCDAVMRDDLRKPHKVRSASGRVSIAAESTQTGHADHFWALALGLRAAQSNSDAWADPGDIDELDELEGAAFSDMRGRSIHPYASGYRRIY